MSNESRTRFWVLLCPEVMAEWAGKVNLMVYDRQNDAEGALEELTLCFNKNIYKLWELQRLLLAVTQSKYKNGRINIEYIFEVY